MRRFGSLILPLVLLVPGLAHGQAEDWGATEEAPEGQGEAADRAASDAAPPPTAAVPARAPARASVLLGTEAPPEPPAPLVGSATPAGSIEVPPDPQSGLAGAVEYRQDDGGGLVGIGDLGKPTAEAAAAGGKEAPLPGYAGVVPGSKDVAEPFDAYLGRKRAYLTWLGYEPDVDRIFIQLSRPVEYTVSRGPNGEIQIDLHDTAIATTNNARPLDLTFFPTVALKVWAKRLRGGDTRLTVTLREYSSYRLVLKGRYIYVQFRG